MRLTHPARGPSLCRRGSCIWDGISGIAPRPLRRWGEKSGVPAAVRQLRQQNIRSPRAAAPRGTGGSGMQARNRTRAALPLAGKRLRPRSQVPPPASQRASASRGTTADGASCPCVRGFSVRMRAMHAPMRCAHFMTAALPVVYWAAPATAVCPTRPNRRTRRRA